MSDKTKGAVFMLLSLLMTAAISLYVTAKIYGASVVNIQIILKGGE